MNKIFFLIFILFKLINLFGQNSNIPNQTEKYYLTEIDTVVSNKYWKNNTNKTEPILRFIKNRNNKTIAKYDISILEFYQGTEIEILEVEKLKNIAEIIHLESNYSAGCAFTESNYYLKTIHSKIVQLPQIKYGNCETSEFKKEYVFPNQNLGVKNEILLIRSNENDNEKNNKLEVLLIYKWNGESLSVK
tara:strand:+ start:53 stop:622 length:570 start_codon:yes stop_codon:yes gene_type:complete